MGRDRPAYYAYIFTCYAMLHAVLTNFTYYVNIMLMYVKDLCLGIQYFAIAMVIFY